MVLDSGRVSVALEGFLEGGSEEGAGRDLACQGAEAGRGLACRWLAKPGGETNRRLGDWWLTNSGTTAGKELAGQGLADSGTGSSRRLADWEADLGVANWGTGLEAVEAGETGW